MQSVLRQVMIAFFLLAALLAAAYIFQPRPQNKPGKYVHREEHSVVEKAAGLHQITALEKARAGTDQLNLKQVYTYHITQYMMDNGGALPASLDELVAAGMDPRHLKDQAGLDVHYELIDGGRRARIYSYGPDYTGGTADDLELIVP